MDKEHFYSESENESSIENKLNDLSLGIPNKKVNSFDTADESNKNIIKNVLKHTDDKDNSNSKQVKDGVNDYDNSKCTDNNTNDNKNIDNSKSIENNINDNRTSDNSNYIDDKTNNNTNDNNTVKNRTSDNLNYIGNKTYKNTHINSMTSDNKNIDNSNYIDNKANNNINDNNTVKNRTSDNLNYIDNKANNNTNENTHINSMTSDNLNYIDNRNVNNKTKTSRSSSSIFKDNSQGIENQIIFCHKILSSKTFVNPNSLEIRSTVEKFPFLFYFQLDSPNHPRYYYNLVHLNPLLNIDDLIYEFLSKFHNQRITDIFTLSEYLKKLSFILKNKEFSRKILRQIFDNVVYLDFNRQEDLLEDFKMTFYKYSILSLVIQQYKRITDQIVIKAITEQNQINFNKGKLNNEKFNIFDNDKTNNQLLMNSDNGQLSLNNINKSQLSNDNIEKGQLSLNNNQLLTDNMIDNHFLFNDHTSDTPNTVINTCPNPIDTIHSVNQISLLSESSKLMKINSDLFCNPLPFIRIEDTSNENTEVLANIVWKNTFYILVEYLESCDTKSELDKIDISIVDFDSFEISCILGLYSSIIQETGCFFENRIFKNSSFLSKISHFPNFLLFLDSVVSNFKNTSKISEIFKPILIRNGSEKAKRILEKIEEKLSLS